jgi:hypothetical protein
LRWPFQLLKLGRFPRFDSCAPAHFETRSLPSSLAASLAVLPSMSLFPNAPFDLSVCPSMSLASPRLHSHRYPRDFTFYVTPPAAPFSFSAFQLSAFSFQLFSIPTLTPTTLEQKYE